MKNEKEEIEGPVYFRWKNDPDAKWIEIGAKEIPDELKLINPDDERHIAGFANFVIPESSLRKVSEILYEKYEDIVKNSDEGYCND